MPFSGISSMEFYVPNNKISLQTQTMHILRFFKYMLYIFGG